MSDIFLTIATLFIIGGTATFFINKKLKPEGKKENWKKYFFYLIIISVVIATILLDKRIFTALILLITTTGLIEMMNISRVGAQEGKNRRFLYYSFLTFAVFFLFFGSFIQLPDRVILYVYTLVLIFDGACQIMGQILGRNKILPVISPHKTWEGFIYGSLITVLVSVILRNNAGFTVMISLMWGIVISLSSFTGDLLASFFKRRFGARNFSELLPGHGGMFDRFDSFLATGAFIGLLGIPWLMKQGMNTDILLYWMIILLFFTVLLGGDFLHDFLKMRPEFTRITSHILAGSTALILLNLFSSHWYILVLCIHCAIFLLVTKKKGLLVSHHRVQRETIGSTLFFSGIIISWYLSFLTSKPWLFTLPILVLTLSDPLAAMTGIALGKRRLPLPGRDSDYQDSTQSLMVGNVPENSSAINLQIRSGSWNHLLSGRKSAKTYLGSLTFLVSATLLLYAGFSHYFNMDWTVRLLSSLIVALPAAITETMSSKGTDNLTVPLVISVLLLLMEKYLLLS